MENENCLDQDFQEMKRFAAESVYPKKKRMTKKVLIGIFSLIIFIGIAIVVSYFTVMQFVGNVLPESSTTTQPHTTTSKHCPAKQNFKWLADEPVGPPSKETNIRVYSGQGTHQEMLWTCNSINRCDSNSPPKGTVGSFLLEQDTGIDDVDVDRIVRLHMNTIVDKESSPTATMVWTGIVYKFNETDNNWTASLR